MAEPSDSRAEKSGSTEKQDTANVVKQEKSTSERRRARHSLPSASTSDRLPSIRQKRDLTLGGVPKRVFTPTIPARRVKKQDNEGPSSATPTPPSAGKKQGKEKQDKKRRDRKKEVVTSASVFSMGPAEKLTDRREVDSVRSANLSVVQSARSEKQSADRSKVKSEGGNRQLSDHDEEEEEPMDTSTTTSKPLLFSSSSNPPVVLPLDNTLHKSCKTQGLSSNSKLEHKSNEDDDTRSPPTCLAPPSSLSTDASSPAAIFSPSKDSKGSFLLFQLPDRLPIHSPPSGDDDSGATKQENEQCRLHDIPEGLIGKLTVHQSGRVRLALGSTYFDVTMGTRGGFLQQLVSIRANDSVPSLVVLGQLSHRVICTPDLESLTNSVDSLS